MIRKEIITMLTITTLTFNLPSMYYQNHALYGNGEKVKVMTASCEESVDKPETIYDLFSEDEIEIFQKCVEAETYTQELNEKVNVANVIYNRVLSEDFPDTFYDVIYQKSGRTYQFSCVLDGSINKRDISEDTIRACELVFEQEDTTQGALYYLNKKYSSSKNIRWFESNLKYLFTDLSNHTFYK